MPREPAFHHFLEASRYSFADRNAYLADPDVLRRAAERPAVEGLRGDAAGADHDDARRPSRSRPATRTRSRRARLRRRRRCRRRRRTSTTSDKWGNVVSYTFTIESTGGAGLVVPGWGFLLNNELTDFNFDSTTHPNRVEGGKRPRSSMAPTIVLKDGKPFLALGSPGGSTIITTVLQILVRPARPRHDAAAGDRRSAREPAEHGEHERRARVPAIPVRTQRRCGRAATTSRTAARSAPRPVSSSCPAAACSPRPSPSAAAAAARWSRTRRRSVERDGSARRGDRARSPLPAELRLGVRAEFPGVARAGRDVLAVDLAIRVPCDARSQLPDFVTAVTAR